MVTLPQRLLAALVLLTSVLAGFRSGPVAAQDAWPTRPVRIVVGFPAGGPMDIPARIIAERLRGRLPQPVVVENRTGASGRIAMDHVLSQPRDGQTLLLCTYIDPLNILTNPGPAGVSLEDLSPVSQITRATYGIAVPNASPARTVGEFVAHARARPEGVAFGHVGAGSMPNLVARRFEALTGIRMTEVPYRGTPPVLQDLIAGRLGFFVGPLVNTMPLHAAGQIRIIAVTGSERLAVAPDVPTLTEAGVPLVAFGWLGVCAARGTDERIVAALNRLVVEAVASAEYREAVEGTGASAVSSSPEDLGRLMRATQEEYGPVLRALNLRLD